MLGNITLGQDKAGTIVPGLTVSCAVKKFLKFEEDKHRLLNFASLNESWKL